MNGNNDILNSLPILDDNNWIRWRKQMQYLFGFHEILEVVTNGVSELVENATDVSRVANKEAKKKDCKTAFYIQSAVGATNFDRISHVELTKEMGEEEKIASYVLKVHNLLHLMKAIQESNNIKTLKLENLVSSLEVHEIGIVERKLVQDSIQALQARVWKKHGGPNKFKGKRDNTHNKKSWSNPQKHKVDDRAYESSKRGEGNSYQQEKDKKGVQCYNCEKWGHLTNNCWYNKDKGATKGKDEGTNLALQDSDDYEDMMVMLVVIDDHIDSKIWFLDSSCSNHMTGRKVWLADFDSSKKSKVKLVDNSSL
ncbi:uncharacterized protein LOC127096268 [Lathyrus oleraceus]|uniref:uncharacterized protein LOC127096268 n=1 Tax=Pisum sativum TaxID=3888 RepID=UPI0021CEEBB8|nr:uncharacterized protein LOC127096268 [Pisum sativum]